MEFECRKESREGSSVCRCAEVCEDMCRCVEICADGWRCAQLCAFVKERVANCDGWSVVQCVLAKVHAYGHAYLHHECIIDVCMYANVQ